jgi:hypothetical protein
MTKKIVLMFLVTLLAVLAYASGYVSGQESVYEKAKNDQNFYEEVWGK